MSSKYEFYNNGKIVKCVNFDGFIDQLDFINNFVKNNTFNTAKEVNVCDNFYGKHDLSTALDGMNYGFTEMTDYFKNVMAQIKSCTKSFDGIFMDYQGFAYDMGAVVSGEPECCVNMGLPVPTPCVKIFVDIAWSSWITAEQILNRGIAITNLINTLLINGCIVDLYAVRYNIQNDMEILFMTKVDTKTLSIANIAFMCSPCYFRKIGWITTDCIRNKRSEAGRGMSRMSDFMLQKLKNDKIFFIGGDYTNSSIVEHIHTIESANKYILEIFKKYCEENKIAITFEENDTEET